MVVIGVTGGVGTGKSTVAKMFRRLGAIVLDADAITHQLMEPKRLVWRRIVRAFGQEMLNEDLTINRRRLAAVVFAHAQRREQLERIIHPQVWRQIRRQLAHLTPKHGVRVVVLDVPLLLEAGGGRLVDVVVVVTAPPSVQRERLRDTFGWPEEEIERRIAAQWDLSAKAALADYTVDNGNGVETTRTQVKRIWQQVARNHSKPSRSSTSRR